MPDTDHLLDPADLPPRLEDVAMLEEVMTRPTSALVRDLACLDGAIMVVGATGKMGPTLCRMAKRAAPDKRIVAVARFGDGRVADQLQAQGIETIACDILDRDQVMALPDAPNVIFMAGRKFGSTGAEHLTWATNVLAPALVAERYRDARIVGLSSGNVYPLMPVARIGATEAEPPQPVGEYAWSCLARERVFENASAQWGTAGRMIRLNYAIDMRYGVLHDIARLVLEGQAVDVAMGHANVIWQGDANAQVLRALLHVSNPVTALNVTGPEILVVEQIARLFGEHLGKPVTITGQPAATALLNDASQAASLFGYPTVPLMTLVTWQADWLARGMGSLGKPTSFQARDGKF